MKSLKNKVSIPPLVSQWKNELLVNASEWVERSRSSVRQDRSTEHGARLTKKVWGRPVAEPHTWMSVDDAVALTMPKYQLLKVTLLAMYEQKKRLLKDLDKEEFQLLRSLDAWMDEAVPWEIPLIG
jgi:hypothetical protein